MSFFVPESRPRGPREPIFLAPPAPLYLAAVFIAVHVLLAILPMAFAEEVFFRAALWAPKFQTGEFAALMEGIASLLAHGFLHEGFFHLAVNCLWLLAAGGAVAKHAGGAAMYVIFALTTIIGGLCFIALEWDGQAAAIGASGGVSGLLAAAVRLHFGARLRIGLAPLTLQPVVAISIMFLGVNAATALWDWAFPAEAFHFAWQAHVGGYVAGLFVVRLVAPRPPLRLV
ncbi:MAG TPA: rhomboid family intramembrane serine protease [Micropepsaceae bacterium]|nr:rhomboid family intramembrane serine protease [Micropepsaceae bacterium]